MAGRNSFMISQKKGENKQYVFFSRRRFRLLLGNHEAIATGRSCFINFLRILIFLFQEWWRLPIKTGCFWFSGPNVPHFCCFGSIRPLQCFRWDRASFKKFSMVARGCSWCSKKQELGYVFDKFTLPFCRTPSYFPFISHLLIYCATDSKVKQLYPILMARTSES